MPRGLVVESLSGHSAGILPLLYENVEQTVLKVYLCYTHYTVLQTKKNTETMHGQSWNVPK